MIKRETDVLIVGGGPVGMFAALSLAERGFDVQIVDKDWRGAAHSYALALHPQTLRLLDEHGAGKALVERGYKVERVGFYRGETRLGELDLTGVGGPFPFVLVVPQSELEHAIEERLRQHQVKVAWNHQAMTVEQDPDGVTAKIGRMEKYSTGYPIAHTEWLMAKEHVTRARYLIGADGYHSFVRKTIGSDYDHVGRAEHFSVFECDASLDFFNETRVQLNADTTDVVWPLGEKRARWSFQTQESGPLDPTLEVVRETVRSRAPWFTPVVEDIGWHTNVLFERRLAKSFGRDRIWLAGDAAHATGPVGGQSMNVGLREAFELAETCSEVTNRGAGADLFAKHGERWRAEWSRMLGLANALRVTDGAPAWARADAARILPCVPASGTEMRALLAQVGLELS